MRRISSIFLACFVAACGGDGMPASPSSSSEPPGTAGPGAPAGTDERVGEDFGDRQLFPADNWWNQDISNAPVDSQSDAFINFIGRTRGAHPDFGPPPYGIPYVGIGGSEPRTPVAFVDYGSESDEGFRGERGYPIPEMARTQPNVIEGGVPGGGSSGDRHLLIVDRDRWVLYELFAARWNAARERWEAGSGAVFDLSSNARRPDLYVTGAMDSRWNNSVLNPAFASLTAGDFEVVRLGWR